MSKCRDCGGELLSGPGRSERCRKCAADARWNDPEYREKAVSGMRRKWKDPEYRERRAEGLRRAWKNPNNWASLRGRMRVEPNRCVDCGAIVCRKSTRCLSCNTKWLWKQSWYREKTIAAWYEARYGKPYRHNGA